MPTPTAEALACFFMLTGAEIRIAQMLARGDSLEQVAGSLNIKMSTARTHLASIFAKTDTCRQAQLVAVLSHVAHM